MSDTELDVSSIESLEAELPDDFASPAQDSRRSSLNVPPVVVEEAAAQDLSRRRDDDGTDGDDESGGQSDAEEEGRAVPTIQTVQPMEVSVQQPVSERVSSWSVSIGRVRSAIAITLPKSRQPSEDKASIASSFVSIADSKADKPSPSQPKRRGQKISKTQSPKDEKPMFLHPMAAATSPGRLSSSGSDTSFSFSSGEEEEDSDSRMVRSVTFSDEGRKTPQKQRPGQKLISKVTPISAKKPGREISKMNIEIVVSKPTGTKSFRTAPQPLKVRKKSEILLMPVEKRRRQSIRSGRKRRSKSRSSSEGRSRSSGYTSGEDEDDGRGKKKKKVTRKRKSSKKKSKKLTFEELEEETKNVLDKKFKKKRKKRKTELNISIEGVMKFSDGEFTDPEDIVPPPDLSPRSAAEYVKTALKRAAARRKKKHLKGKKRSDKDKDGKKKKKKKRKGKKKKKKKKKKGGYDSDSGPSDSEIRRAAPVQQHFYPTPQNLMKKRCAFVSEAKPVICTICDGIHYRTKRNFAANLKIIINVNKALTKILSEMRSKMKKIDVNLERVKRNLEYMEDMYEGVFRKVNRLIA